MSDPSLHAALKAKKFARDAIYAEVALLDIRINECRSITQYMEACQNSVETVAKDVIFTDLTWMDAKIKEYRLMTQYMEACQKTNLDSLAAANMQLSQLITYMAARRMRAGVKQGQDHLEESSSGSGEDMVASESSDDESAY
jgi:hypothetical protein